MKSLATYLKMLRTKQWLKNTLVFLPIIIFPSSISLNSVFSLITTFTLFCVSASLVYLVNDWSDRVADSKHHTKKLRPFASGELGYLDALVSFVILAALFILLCIKLFESSPLLVLLMLIYLAQSFLYSFYLKNVTLLEMLIVSTGYSYRALAGGLSVDLLPSMWILVTIFLASIFMVAQKRLADIATAESLVNLRNSIQLYPKGFLTLVTGVSASAAIVSFMLFTLSDYAEDEFSNQYLPFMSLFIIYGTFRYIQVTMSSSSGHDPIKLILNDWHLKICMVLSLLFLIITNWI
ncbi:UbiA prenyltransferase family protein [Shewanella sp.]|uniref:UbiA prenyltransferase family protein n=1 Tax=Shewanella sp. TaxID=50422 RepID=UPI004048A2B9